MAVTHHVTAMIYKWFFGAAGWKKETGQVS